MATRINGAMMPQFNQQTVSLVGELSAADSSLICCDGTRVQLTGLPPNPPTDKYVEIIAKCDVPNRLTLDDPSKHFIVPLGDALDAALVQQAIQLMHHDKLKPCFERVD